MNTQPLPSPLYPPHTHKIRIWGVGIRAWAAVAAAVKGFLGCVCVVGVCVCVCVGGGEDMRPNKVRTWAVAATFRHRNYDVAASNDPSLDRMRAPRCDAQLFPTRFVYAAPTRRPKPYFRWNLENASQTRFGPALYGTRRVAWLRPLAHLRPSRSLGGSNSRP